MKRLSIALAVSLLVLAGSTLNEGFSSTKNPSSILPSPFTPHPSPFKGNHKLQTSNFKLQTSTPSVRYAATLSQPPVSFTLTLTGDLLLDRRVRQRIAYGGVDRLFTRSIDSVFRSSDAVVANLECPATSIHAPAFKQIVFRAEPQWLTTLRAHGITHLNLANNHSTDQGRKGLADTRNNIIAAGMTPVGAGNNMNEAAQPVLLTNTPRRVWLVASNRLALENFAYLPDKPCVSQEPMDSLVSRVRNLYRTDTTAVIVVSLHWGGEHTLKPVPQQRVEARRLIEAGASALVCHHTHTLQTIEYYHGRPIFYSIGNFIFDQQRPLNTRACMVRLTVTADTVRTETIPIKIEHCIPHLSPSKDKR